MDWTSARVIDEAEERELCQDFPRPIAEAYARSASCREPVAEQKALLDLAEVAVRYLALVAHAELQHHRLAASGVEAHLADRKPPTFGRWLALFREASVANQRSILSFPVGETIEPPLFRRAVGFVTLWQRLTSALDIGVPSAGFAKYLDQFKGSTPPKLGFWKFWDAVVACRNKAAHGMLEVAFLEHLNPALRAGLVDALLLPPLKAALVGYPWAEPVGDAVYRGGRFRLELRYQTPSALRPIEVLSAEPLEARGYLVRRETGQPYVAFTFGGWPAAEGQPEPVPVPEPEPAPAPPPAPSNGGARKYEARYRELVTARTLDAAAEELLADLADVAGLSADEVRELRARVDADVPLPQPVAVVAPGTLVYVPLPGGLQMALVSVPAGRFKMGSPMGEEGRNEDEGSQHSVWISRPFLLGRTPVTQAEWRAVMYTNPSDFGGLGGRGLRFAAGTSPPAAATTSVSVLPGQ